MSEKKPLMILARTEDGPPMVPSVTMTAHCGCECWCGHAGVKHVEAGATTSCLPCSGISVEQVIAAIKNRQVELTKGGWDEIEKAFGPEFTSQMKDTLPLSERDEY